MPAKFKIGDEVIVIKVDSNQQEFLHKTFKIETISDYGIADGKILDRGEVSLFLHKLELLSVYESPLYQELK